MNGATKLTREVLDTITLLREQHGLVDSGGVGMGTERDNALAMRSLLYSYLKVNVERLSIYESIWLMLTMLWLVDNDEAYENAWYGAGFDLVAAIHHMDFVMTPSAVARMALMMTSTLVADGFHPIADLIKEPPAVSPLNIVITTNAVGDPGDLGKALADAIRKQGKLS